MKKCPDCGAEYPDETQICTTCRATLISLSASQDPEDAPAPPWTASPGELRLWDKMKPRQFAILFIRLQAVWLLFNAVIDITYLPPYLLRLNNYSPGSIGYGDYRLTIGMTVLRIILNVAGAVAAIQYAERIVSWFVKDWVAEDAAIKVPPPSVASPPDATQGTG